MKMHLLWTGSLIALLCQTAWSEERTSCDKLNLDALPTGKINYCMVTGYKDDQVAAVDCKNPNYNLFLKNENTHTYVNIYSDFTKGMKNYEVDYEYAAEQVVDKDPLRAILYAYNCLKNSSCVSNLHSIESYPLFKQMDTATQPVQFVKQWPLQETEAVSPTDGPLEGMSLSDFLNDTDFNTSPAVLYLFAVNKVVWGAYRLRSAGLGYEAPDSPFFNTLAVFELGQEDELCQK